MALERTVETDFDVSATYWHIHTVELHPDNDVVNVTLAGWSTEAARRKTGKRPIAATTVTLDFPNLKSQIPTYAEIYAVIKTVDDWSDAQDVIDVKA